MLEDIMVVQSAVSAFNNAALWAPAFLWWAILALPLFVVVYWFGAQIMQKIGWNRENILNRVTIWTAGLTLLWVVMFAGNYGILRNELSVLPFLIAVIVFLTSLFVSSHLRTCYVPRDWRWWLFCIFLIVMIALSDLHAWWGPLLQVGAFLFGGGLGRMARSEMRPIAGTVLIVMVTTIAILMQPEFFRFGQLGNLTIVHLLGILILGVLSIAIIALFNIKPADKIRFAVFIKLKWLLRVICTLGAALFILTEAIPIFIGTLGALFLLFMMSIRHMRVVNVSLGHKCFALLLIMFGIVTVMPVISALGIIYWTTYPEKDFWRQIKRLL